MPGGKVPCGSCSMGSDTQHSAWHPVRSVNTLRTTGREKNRERVIMGLLCGASELSLKAADSARHTHPGGHLDPLPTSASGANPGHFLFGCPGVPWTLNREESPAPFLFLALASATVQPDRAAPSVHSGLSVSQGPRKGTLG